MSDSSLVNVILNRLRQVGYLEVATPLRVAAVDFEFTAALRGRDGRALDLVLIADTTTGGFGDREGTRVRQRVEALSRALDISRSRYVVTLILAGAALGSDIDFLAETCRVLHVDGVSIGADGQLADKAARDILDDRIRILLPLSLPPQLFIPTDGGGPAIDQLQRALPAGLQKDLFAVVFSASQLGEQAVTDAMASVIGASLAIKDKND